MPSWLTILCALLAVHLFALEALAERAEDLLQMVRTRAGTLALKSMLLPC